MLLHPLVAYRSCEMCKAWQFDEDTGKIVQWRGGPLKRIGKTPCESGPEKCPKGSPTAGRELSEKNWQAYDHYQESKAVGEFPNDAIVRRNAVIIAAVSEAAQSRKEEMFRNEIRILATRK